MKVWLDDSRPAPDGWLPAKTAGEAIALLVTGAVEELSLDHTLGHPGELEVTGDGFTVLDWLEDQVANHGFAPPGRIAVHSSNRPVVPAMEQQAARILRRAGRA